MDLGQDHLVVQPLELGQQRVDEGQRGLVLVRLQLEGDEPGFEGVFEEDAFFALGPGGVVGEGVDLDLLAVWDGVEEVEEGADCYEVGVVFALVK